MRTLGKFVTLPALLFPLFAHAVGEPFDLMSLFEW